MKSKWNTRGMAFGLLLAFVGLLGSGCAGTITQAKDGKTRVQMCQPAMAVDGQRNVFVRCHQDKPAQKKAKKKAKKVQVSGVDGLLLFALP